MSLINDRDREKVRGMLAGLAGPVTLVNFTQELACDYCRETEQLVREVSGLSEQVTVQVHNFQIDKDQVAKYRVDKIPAIVVEGARDYGIRFYGIPLGYEFVSLLGAIEDVSRGATTLSDETRAALKGVHQPLHLQVYVTPT